ncbi:uncharacterized protein O3C94_005215 [Discoglossus pictus]
MWQRLALSAVLRFWLAVSFSSGQSGDDILAELGSGFLIDTLRDQPKESPTPTTKQCHYTFVTPTQDTCIRKEDPQILKEEVTYLRNILQDNDRVLQSLIYTVNADAQDLGYQEVISEHNKGIQEDNKEFYGILNKVMQELHTRLDDESPDVSDEKKKLKKSFHMMEHLLQTTSRLADKLDKTSQELDGVLQKQLERSTTLVYRHTIRS